jgi:transmembrane sensor
VRRQRNRRRAFAGVAGVAMLLAATAMVWRLDRPGGVDVAKQSVTSLAVIRPTIQKLPDGSVVELKDEARISADFSGKSRVVDLSNGTAYFQVAPDANRPFVVRAGGLAVQAIGTAFTVELEHGELRVLVTEGKVQIDPSHENDRPSVPAVAPLVSLIAGGSAVFPLATGFSAKPTLRMLDSAELHQRLGWRIPKLEFTRTPLSEVVAQMNRYNARKFVLGDDAVGEVRVSGILRADKIETLAETLESDFKIRVERQADSIVLRRRN